MPEKRNYNYDLKYQSSPEQVKNRVARNKARRNLTKKLGESALKGKDVDHRKPLSKGGSTKGSNLRLRSVSSNRGDKSMMKKKCK